MLFHDAKGQRYESGVRPAWDWKIVPVYPAVNGYLYRIRKGKGYWKTFNFLFFSRVAEKNSFIDQSAKSVQEQYTGTTKEKYFFCGNTLCNLNPERAKHNCNR